MLTNIGDSLYLIAALWLVHELTGSTLYTGLAGFLLRAPRLIQFLAGPLVDQWNLRRTLIATQVIQGVFVLVVPLAATLDLLSVWVVLAVIPTLATVSRLQYPAQTALLPLIVEDDQLVRANSLFKMTGRSADIAFNAGAGVLIAVIGATQLFLVDAVTFAAASVLFLGVKLPSDEQPKEETESDESVFDDYVEDLREGIKYLRGSLLIPIGIGGVIANFGSGIMTAVFPAFADALGGPEMYGLLMAALVAGNLGGAAGSALIEDLPYGVFSVVGFGVTAVAMFGAVFFRGQIATPVLLCVAFLPIGAFNVLLGSLMQSAVEQEFLGRVSSAFSSFTTLTLPLGSLVGGVVGGAFSPAGALYLISLLVALLAVYFAVTTRIRTLTRVADLDADAVGLGTPVTD